MKRIFLTYCLLLLAFAVVAQQPSFQKNQKNYANEAVQTVKQFRKTSPLLLNEQRLQLLKTFETYSDPYSNAPFRAYLAESDAGAEQLEHTVPILYSYREAFDKVLHEVKTVKVKKGTAKVWLLYNMGFVVKTPSGCFGIDVDHRYAEALAPYLDFLCITHNHGDHANVKLMEAMTKAGKPVLSNFYKGDEKHLSKVPTTYSIGNFNIRTDFSDHLKNANLLKFVTTYRIDCGADAGDFSILHCGDSGFTPAQFTKVDGPVSLVVLRWGAPVENQIFGTGPGQIQTDYAVLSHLIELRHDPFPKGQASITQTLKHLPNVHCKNTLIPFWGEMLTWKKGKLIKK